LLSTIKERERGGAKKVLIDGIRHPSEMEILFKNGFNPHFLGVVADTVFTFDQQIRYRRLLASNDRPGFQNLSWEDFREQDRLEWGSDDDPYGNQIGTCFELMRTTLRNSSHMIVNGEGSRSVERFRTNMIAHIQIIEGRQNRVEQK